MVLKEFFDPEATAGTLLGHCEYFDRRSSDHCLNGSIFSIEEHTGLSERLMYTTTDLELHRNHVHCHTYQAVVVIEQKSLYKQSMTRLSYLLIHLVVHQMIWMTYGLLKIAQIEMKQNQLMKMSNVKKRHSNTMWAGNNKGVQHSLFQQTPTIQLHQVSEAADDNVTRDSLQMIEDIGTDIFEEPVSKKRRAMVHHFRLAEP
ncbi:uncharacterized protein LOC133294002 [Gastrolobium bilobum]|uniref:uncharacterized protein LOC133294002 n=1 Tax=Gastrolobium bilobum TaxID=150636 RepID=UPI002AB054AA|nr:uncharacterized protein LOC133294002 [Gastrolobium bilobum]